MNLGNREASIDVDPGETVECTYTNVELSAIVVEKVTDPADASDLFEFTTDAGSNDTFDLAGGESEVLSLEGLDTGDYVVYCNIAGHREAGMETSMTIEEGAEISSEDWLTPAMEPATSRSADTSALPSLSCLLALSRRCVSTSAMATTSTYFAADRMFPHPIPPAPILLKSR